MKTRLLKQLRKRYSYLWINNVLSEYYRTEEDGSRSYHTTTELRLVMVNERTKKTEHIYTDTKTTPAIAAFLQEVLGQKYWLMKCEKEDKRSTRLYHRFKKRQQQVYPGVILFKTLNGKS